MNDIYLLRLEISGIKNIEKPIEILFYKKTIKNDFDPENYRVKGIYGENGSGKTAVMMAVKILTRILIEKNFLSDSVNQRLFVENINKKAEKGYIEAEFYSKNRSDLFIYRYRASFEIREDKRVYLSAEKLDRKSGRYTQNPFIPVFETKNGILLRFGSDELFSFSREKTLNLLDQRSLVTFVHDIMASGCHLANTPIYDLLDLLTFAATVDVYVDGEDDHRNYICRTLLVDIKDSRALPTNIQDNIMKETETPFYPWASTVGQDSRDMIVPKIAFSSYQKRVAQLTAFIRLFKTDLKNIEIDAKDIGNDLLKCRLVMIYDGYELDAEYESRGIRKLMSLFDVLDAACRGSIIFIDELDSNINDVYLIKLIEYFQYYGKGQLCFTAHNLSPMSVLRNSKNSISFLSGINTVHTWTSNGNQNPEHAYREGFIEDSPFNVDASDFLGILGGEDE